jgi:UDP-N-acetylmuramate dehydrogenase
MNLVGIEALSLIPGTVGASPVQNIGAYGSEVKDTIVEVEVFDTEKREFSKISNKDCNFGYRDSIFKNEAKGRYIITEVTYRLNKSLPSIPKYPGVAKYFEDMEIVTPNLSQIRDAIIYIRKEKLPDSNTTPNVGSFFKNPIVLNDVANRIKIDFPDAKFFSVDERHIKVPAGWLIENAGLKGKSFGNVSVYDKNALVLVNMKDASFEDIISARDKIIKTVKERFGIVLEQEPEII